jgi:hypothetical protein
MPIVRSRRNLERHTPVTVVRTSIAEWARQDFFALVSAGEAFLHQLALRQEKLFRRQRNDIGFRKQSPRAF